MPSRARHLPPRARSRPRRLRPGQSLVEYGLLLSFVAILGLLVARLFGDLLSSFWQQIVALLDALNAS